MSLQACATGGKIMIRTRLIALSKGELLKLLKTARERNHKHFCLFLLMAVHGLRISEAVQLRTTNFKDGFLSVKRLKNSLASCQPLLATKNPLLDEQTAIHQLLEETPEGGFLFTTEWFGTNDKSKPLTRYAGNFLI